MGRLKINKGESTVIKHTYRPSRNFAFKKKFPMNQHTLLNNFQKIFKTHFPFDMIHQARNYVICKELSYIGAYQVMCAERR